MMLSAEARLRLLAWKDLLAEMEFNIQTPRVFMNEWFREQVLFHKVPRIADDLCDLNLQILHPGALKPGNQQLVSYKDKIDPLPDLK